MFIIDLIIGLSGIDSISSTHNLGTENGYNDFILKIFLTALGPILAFLGALWFENRKKKKQSREELLGALEGLLAIFSRNRGRIKEVLENLNKFIAERVNSAFTFRLVTVDIDQYILFLAQRLNISEIQRKQFLKELTELLEEHNHMNMWLDVISKSSDECAKVRKEWLLSVKDADNNLLKEGIEYSHFENLKRAREAHKNILESTEKMILQIEDLHSKL